MSQPDDIRRYAVRATTTDVFGRVLASARDQHHVVDGPVQNGCPGEAITPAELFLSGVAACGAELIQVLAAQSGVPLRGVKVGGKTGTAEVGDGTSHSWFIGFAPADNPKVAVAVIMEHQGSGSDFATPAAQKVLQAVLSTR